MAAITLTGIKKRFGTIETIHGVDLTIDDGEFTVLVGPSGCGKSTLLRMLAGLEGVSDGRINIGGRDVTHLPPSARRVAMVFQSYALYPHMNVRENLSFGMRMRGVDRATIDAKVANAVDVLQLAPYLDRKPAELSGGQAQRVAIGRALVQDPDVFLFDEPLSNLDAELRLKMRVELAALHARLGKTMIYVTHDQVEAMTLADKIVVLRDGRVEQQGAPLALYSAPTNAFVAGFIGSPAMNFIPCTLRDHTEASVNATKDVPSASGYAIQIAGKTWTCRTANASLDGAMALLGVRPEHIRLLDSPAQISASDPAVFAATVAVVEQLGATSYVHVDLVDMGSVPTNAASNAAQKNLRLCVEWRAPMQTSTASVVAEPWIPDLEPGRRVYLKIDPRTCHLFDARVAAHQPRVDVEFVRVSAQVPAESSLS
jgi:lactose/L-arabinose transport system ATP-binding protein